MPADYELPEGAGVERLARLLKQIPGLPLPIRVLWLAAGGIHLTVDRFENTATHRPGCLVIEAMICSPTIYEPAWAVLVEAARAAFPGDVDDSVYWVDADCSIHRFIFADSDVMERSEP